MGCQWKGRPWHAATAHFIVSVSDHRMPRCWWTSFLGVSVRKFPDEIRLSETDLSPVWVGLFQSVEGLNGAERQRKGRFSLSAYLSCGTRLLLSSTWDLPHQSPVLSLDLYHQSPDSQTFRLRYHQLSWVFRLQPADCGPSLPPQWHKLIPYNKSVCLSVCLPIYPLTYVFIYHLSIIWPIIYNSPYLSSI